MPDSWQNWTCPKCGDNDGFNFTRRAGGRWDHSYCPASAGPSSFSGIPESGIETSTELITMGPTPKTAICVSCEKRVPNPVYTA